MCLSTNKVLLLPYNVWKQRFCPGRMNPTYFLGACCGNGERRGVVSLLWCPDIAGVVAAFTASQIEMLSLKSITYSDTGVSTGCHLFLKYI